MEICMNNVLKDHLYPLTSLHQILEGKTKPRSNGNCTDSIGFPTFPHGLIEPNLDWLFSTDVNRKYSTIWLSVVSL